MQPVFGTKIQRLILAESQQVSTRLIVVSIMLAFVSLFNIGIIRFDKLQVNDIVCQFLFIVSFLISIFLMVHHGWKPKQAHERIIVGLVHDVVVTSVFLLFSREKMPLLLFIYPWITIGHGFRFGEKYLLVAALFTSFGLLMLFKVSPYWSAFAPIGFDLGMIFVLVASYTGYMLRDLSTIKEYLEAVATHDPLTGLVNRRIVEDQLPSLLDQNREVNHPLGLIYFDLDGFKPVNDTLGHESGDTLLRYVAKVVTAAVTPHDIVARVGGDEFVVILRSIESEVDLKVRARAILKSIESIKDVRGRQVEISASLGCLYVDSKTPRELSNGQFLIREADRLMYASKQAGRGVLSMAKTEDLRVLGATA